MDPHVVYGWLIRGLGGLVNLLERMDRDKARITTHFAEQLSLQVERLRKIADNARERSE